MEALYYQLTFASACVTLTLALLLLGIRISRQAEFRPLRRSRNYLAAAYCLLAAAGLASWAWHIEWANDTVQQASTLLIASYQAFLFTTTCLVFIRPSGSDKRFIGWNLLIITVGGVLLLLTRCILLFSILYLLQLLYYVWLFRRTYARSRKRLEQWYDEEQNARLRWVKGCFYGALTVGAWALATLFCGNGFYCLFIVAYTLYYAYLVHRFYRYMAQAGTFIRAFAQSPAQEREDEFTAEERAHLAEKVRALQTALEAWVQAKAYCRADVGVDDVIAELGTSRALFRYYFRTEVGMDFRAWRMVRRVEEARRLIEADPTLPPDEICRRAGFNHRSNLHRQFSKIVGMTPSEYKNRTGTHRE